MNKANEIESRIIDALSLEELALCLIKKQYHVSRVSATTDPITIHDGMNNLMEIRPSNVTKIEAAIVLNNETMIVIEKEVRKNELS
ncbi:hypothetical protein [Bacillus altitudinis]|uniref:hypothetical protein n=1 Tax=Bacillus altitudinis TaxID=293387 RepID=UPI0021019202|nr:hypothetical protein [Bacillus altitudinis]UTV34832.1 hypothetical protein NM966_19760 [Bacillus altitudinis]